MGNWLKKVSAALEFLKGTDFAALVNTSMSMLVAIDGDGSVVGMSAPARHVFCGRIVQDGGVRFDNIFVGTTLKSLLRGSRAQNVNARRADGTVFSVLSSRTIVRNGWTKQYVFVLIDETERLVAEAKARESSALLHSVMKAVTDPIIVCDPDGIFLTVNEAAARLAGLTVEKMLNKAIDSEEIPGWMASSMAGCRAAASSASSNGDMITSPIDDISGEARKLQWTSYPLPPRSDGRHSLITIIRDVTQERAVRAAAYEAKDRAEKAELEKTRFLAAASHDLRQPIQSMVVALDMLSNSALGDKERKLVSYLQRNVETIGGLLDNLLDLSRLQAGAGSASFTCFELKDLLTQVEATHTGVASRKGIDFKVHGCDGLYVCSDKSRLGQILQNFVANALRYTATGSIGVHCALEDDNVVIEVRDTGMGIPAERIPHIWGEYTQIADRQSDLDKGVGLGLSIVTKLSELLKHPVWVQSMAGKGSSFFVRVPVAESPLERAVEPSATPITVSADGRVAVLIDDNEEVLIGLEMYLVSAGYQVIAAGSLQGALKKIILNDVIPDVIVSDYRLSDGLNGVDAIRTIRGELGATIPGFVLTGETDDTVNSGIRSDPSLTLLHKPVSSRGLADSLQAAWV
jgi:PAS domain S-box-containing protein